MMKRIGGLAVLTLAAVTWGCGSSEASTEDTVPEAELNTQPPTSSGGTTSPLPSDPQQLPSSTPNSGDPPDTTTPDASTDAGTTPAGDSGSGGTTPTADAGIPGAFDGSADSCSGGTLEKESNDDAATANPFTGKACGKIDPPNESDFFSFTMKATSTRANVAFSGNIKLKITVDGKSTTISPQGGGGLTIAPGKPYLFEVKSNDGKAQNYSFTFNES